MMSAQPSFDLELIRRCLCLYDFSPYGSPLPSPLEKVFTRGGGSTMKPQFFLAKGGNDLYISVRGAAEPGDFAIVLEFNREDFLDGKVHKGVLDSARWIIEQCNSYIENCTGNIICTGHSLGGATSAMIATLLRYEKGIDNVFAISFAPFPIFSESVAQMSKDFICSFVYGNDVVPHLSAKTIGTLVNMFIPPGPQQQNGINMMQGMVMRLLQGIMQQNGMSDYSSTAQINARMPKIMQSLIQIARGEEKEEFFVPGTSYHFIRDNGEIVCRLFDETLAFNIMASLVGIADHSFLNYEEAIICTECLP